MWKKLTSYFIPAVIFIVFLFSPRPPTPNNGFFLTFILFTLFYWQRKRIKGFLTDLKWPKSDLGKFLLLGIVWSLLVERALGRQGEVHFPFIAFLISLSFTLPYFIIWHQIIKRTNGFAFKEVFLLSGLSGALAQTLFTPKVLAVFGLAKFFPALLMAIFNFLSILVMFGMFTSLPVIFVFKENKGKGTIVWSKKRWLELASVFLALPFFLSVIIILRIISRWF